MAPQPNPGAHASPTGAASLWERVIGTFSARFRRARARRIMAMAPEIMKGRVCDLGGSLHFWEAVATILAPADLTILNVRHDAQSKSHGGNSVHRVELYDGRVIPYPDAHFDVLLCNSVIEHVSPPLRAALCADMRRVARRVIVQTPAYAFPVEPHFVMPFIHWLPRAAARRLAHVSPWRLLSRPSTAHINAYFSEITLLRRTELQALLPQARIVTERFAALPKSYLAVIAPETGAAQPAA